MSINIDTLSQQQLSTAFKRLDQLRNVERLKQDGLKLPDAIQKTGLSRATYHRWKKAFEKDGVAGLADRCRERRGGVRVMPETHYAYMCDQLLTVEKPHVKTVYDIDYKMFCDSIGEKPVSYSTFLRAYNDIPEAVKLKYRGGPTAYTDSQPFIVRDLSSLEPLEVIVSDHYQMDIAMIGSGGRVVFPWVTWWMDMATRHPLGWVLSEKPNQDTINLALRTVILNHGIPTLVYIDNGRDYKSKMFTGMTRDGVRYKRFRMDLDELAIRGIYQMLKIEVSFAMPYNAKAKAIEPAHRTLHNLERRYYGYRGTGPEHRTPYMSGKVSGGTDIDLKRLPNYREMKARLDEIMMFYSERPHDGLKGQSTKAVFENRMVALKEPRRIPDERVLNRMMMKIGNKFYRVSAQGIRFKGEWYYTDELLAFEGGKVALRYDPDNIDRRGNVRQVYIYDAKDQFLCVATLQGRAPARSAKGKIFDDLGHRKKLRRLPVDEFKREQESILQRLADRDFYGMPDA